MAVWAIADLHLSFGVPNKSMDVFGPQWVGYTEKIKANWIKNISSEDLVLIPGDISWALRVEDAIPDLTWIHELPGTKVIIRGNHDYWWTSLSKIEKVLPPSIHLIQNNVFNWKDVSVGGARLWDSQEYSFHHCIDYKENGNSKKISDIEPDTKEAERIFTRELSRLELSLKGLNPNAATRIVMTHYPPIGLDMQPSRVSDLLQKYRVNTCVFGHLHNVKEGMSLFGEKDRALHQGILFLLTSCDYLHFNPIKILD